MNQAIRDRELEEAKVNFAKKDFRIENDVLIWNSNDRHPMNDLMERWLELGLVTDVQFFATEVARDESNALFFAEYREAQKSRTPEQIAEERFNPSNLSKSSTESKESFNPIPPPAACMTTSTFSIGYSVALSFSSMDLKLHKSTTQTRCFSGLFKFFLTESKSSWLRDTMMSVKPLSANASDMIAPNPLEAPVIRAILLFFMN